MLAGLFTTDDSDDDSRTLRRDGRFAVEEGYAGHPVTEVYWWGAVLYCRSRGARLPTEAEWEATARGVEGRTYPWGDEPPDGTRAHLVRILPAAGRPGRHASLGSGSGEGKAM